MKTSRTTQGVTLVLTVLIVAVLMATILVVTSNVVLSGRVSSAAQQATLQTQYVAESGVARAQARLNVVNAVLKDTADNAGNRTGGIQVPSGTSSLVVQNAIMALCNVSSLPNSGMMCGTDGKSKQASSPFPTISPNDSARLALFTSYIPQANIVAAGYPIASDDAAKTFWTQTFGGSSGAVLNNSIANSSALGTFKTSVGLNILGVERTATDSFNIYIAIPDVSATGTLGTSARALNVESANSVYTMTVSRDSFAKYALFTNHHFSDATAESGCQSSPNSCSRITFTSNTLFSGPVHTNEVFNFTGTPYFAGPVTSAGCRPGGITTTNGADSCGGYTQGAYAQDSAGRGFQNFTAAAALGNNTAPTLCSSAAMPTLCTDAQTKSTYASTPKFQGGINWSAGFQQLPANGNDQQAAALSGGLYLGTPVSNMKLSVGPVTPAGGTSDKMQLITYTQNGVNVQLATNKDKQVFFNYGGTWLPAVQLSKQVDINGVSVAAGSWVPASLLKEDNNKIAATTFNGVIFAQAPTNKDGTVRTDISGKPLDGITDLNGPDRTPADATTSTPDNTPPAVADFAQLNVVSNGTVHITSDLTYESPPCSGGNSVNAGVFTGANCNNLTSTNILGVYSSEGDVALNSPKKYDGGLPADAKIQAVLMASKGKVTVDGYDSGSASDNLGRIHLLGGIIENYYGAFGLTDGHGYGRDFVYDPRTAQGVLPPSFPTLKNWTSTLNAQLKLTSSSQVQMGLN